mgnify:CR=1 FL=1
MDLLEFGSITIERLNDELLVRDGDNVVKITEEDLEHAIEAALRGLIKGKL